MLPRALLLQFPLLPLLLWVQVCGLCIREEGGRKTSAAMSAPQQSTGALGFALLLLLLLLLLPVLLHLQCAVLLCIPHISTLMVCRALEPLLLLLLPLLLLNDLPGSQC
jgi:hypothetical protein